MRAALAAFGLLSAAAISGCSTTGVPKGAPDQMAYDAQSDFIVTAQLRERPIRLKVDPGAPWYVVLNESVAKSAGLVGLRGATLVVGPVKLRGKTRTEKLDFGNGLVSPVPVMWFKGEAIGEADGVINPAQLPTLQVTMQLGPPRPGERTIEVPMHFDQQRGLYHDMEFGGQAILTRFTLLESLSTATGATASIIAKRRSGAWSGEQFSQPVRYGIVRPVRKMVFAEPISVEGLTLTELGVRFLDDRGDLWLPDREVAVEDEDANSDAQVDESDIVVTGKQRKRIFGRPHYWLMVGRDDLNRCSSLTYDRKASRITLRCSVTQ